VPVARRTLNVNLLYIFWAIILGTVYNDKKELNEVEGVIRRLKQMNAA